MEENEKPSVIIPLPVPGNKAYVIDPSGKSKVYDFDNPDTDMLRQMADVLINRLGKVAVLRMLYLDQKTVPPELKQIVQDLVDQKINQDQAKERVLDWQAKLPRT